MKKIFLCELLMLLLPLSLQALTITQKNEISRNQYCLETLEYGSLPDPVSHQTLKVTFRKFTPWYADAKTPLVLILPAQIGETMMEKRYGQDLCARKMGAVVIKQFDHDQEMFQSWGAEELYMKRAVAVSQGAMTLTRGPIGILSTSIGSMVAGIVIGLDKEDRIKARVLIAAGHSLTYVLSVSEGNHMRSVREQRMRVMNLATEKDYEKRLKQVISMDPERFIKGHQNPARTLMIIPLSDNVVPPSSQWTTWKLMGEPKVIQKKNLGHVSGAIAAYFQNGREIVDHINQQIYR